MLSNPVLCCRLLELEEELEACDAAIDFKNDSIANCQQEIPSSVTLIHTSTSLVTSSSAITSNILGRLQLLSATELRMLLSRYFEKIVDLRDDSRKLQSHYEELVVSTFR